MCSLKLGVWLFNGTFKTVFQIKKLNLWFFFKSNQYACIPIANTWVLSAHILLRPPIFVSVHCQSFLRRPKGRRSNIALDLQFMQIFTDQKYS